MLSLLPSEVRDLPADELGLLILADLASGHVRNEQNYTLQYAHDARYREHGAEGALEAVSEGFGWLRGQGMLARPAGEGNADVFFISRRGKDALSQDVATIRAISRIQVDLHPLLERKVRRQFLLGEYENAIFTAMREVEIRVRDLAGYGDDEYGLDLMTHALNHGGPLSDPAVPKGESLGTMHFFRGAYAVLRNPSGHREVSFEDVTEASEAVMTASLLMRMLDKVEKRLRS